MLLVEVHPGREQRAAALRPAREAPAAVGRLFRSQRAHLARGEVHHRHVGLRRALQPPLEGDGAAVGGDEGAGLGDVGRGGQVHDLAAGGRRGVQVPDLGARPVALVDHLARGGHRDPALPVVGLRQLQRESAHGRQAPQIVAAGEVGGDHHRLPVRPPGGALAAADVEQVGDRGGPRVRRGVRRHAPGVGQRPVRRPLQHRRGRGRPRRQRQAQRRTDQNPLTPHHAAPVCGRS